MQYIEINKDLIPYKFQIVLDKKVYTFEIYYNYRYQFFTINLLRNNKIIVKGEKIIYGQPLFLNHQHLDIPVDTMIIPLDLRSKETEVNWRTLQNTVRLYIFKKSELGGN